MEGTYHHHTHTHVQQSRQSEDEFWDELKRGIRVFHFVQRRWTDVLHAVWRTLELFEPMMIGPGVYTS